MPESDQSEGKGGAFAKRRKRLAAAVAAIALAALTAIASGFGDKLVEWITKEDPVLISYGVEEQGSECGSITYLPGVKAKRTARGPTPYETDTDWRVFQHQPGAAYADKDLVQVSVVGESVRKVDLTGIEFTVERNRRRDGATFSAPCGGGAIGRGVFVDVEATPAHVLSSSASVDGYIEAVKGAPGTKTAPISFPWRVSLTEPLLLYVVATAHACDCTWSAEIPWTSGGEHGVIEIDNGGRGFRVVGIDGLAGYSVDTVDNNGWRRYREPGEPPS